MVWLGTVWYGEAEARLGSARDRRGQAGFGMAFRGAARSGWARRFEVRPGEAWCGIELNERRLMNKAAAVTAIGEVVTNGGAAVIDTSKPYAVEVEIEGSAALLFHRWNCEAVEEKAKAKKGSKAKKEDNIESYVYRLPDGELALLGEALRMSIVQAAKYQQDPRSPRKSAMDLFKAGIVAETELAGLGAKDWDFLDRRRVVVQRSAITRERPAMRPGWRAVVVLRVLTPEYIQPSFLNEVITAAGRLVGVGDFRPTYGRFQLVRYELLN